MEELEGEKEGETEGAREGGGEKGEAEMGRYMEWCARHACISAAAPPPPCSLFFRDTNIPAKGRMIPFRKTALLQDVTRVRQRRGKGNM